MEMIHGGYRSGASRNESQAVILRPVRFLFEVEQQVERDAEEVAGAASGIEHRRILQAAVEIGEQFGNLLLGLQPTLRLPVRPPGGTGVSPVFGFTNWRDAGSTVPVPPASAFQSFSTSTWR